MAIKTQKKEGAARRSTAPAKQPTKATPPPSKRTAKQPSPLNVIFGMLQQLKSLDSRTQVQLPLDHPSASQEKGNAICDLASAPRENRMRSLLEELHRGIELISTSVCNLEDKIAPVTRPAPPNENKSSTLALPDLPPALAEIQSANYRLSHLFERLNDLIVRIDL